MRSQIFALLTAAAWGIGGYFEKRGLMLGNLSPQIGITIRTAVALIILAAVSAPQWKTILEAGPRPVLYVVLGGGVLAGAIGMLCFYVALKGGALSQVMPIAFTSPLFGVLMAALLGGSSLQPKHLIGMALTVGGIALVSSG
ncbi:EamA family transporter [Candidatus Bipolaricaulota bacterium]|nr:EamA family transporter [Candidatus Bipolaricaulota bacterium]